MNANLSDLAARIRAEISAEHAAVRQAVKHAIEAGRFLIDAKKAVKAAGLHWLPWLEANCKIRERSAQERMKLARIWPTLDEPIRNAVAGLSFREAIRALRLPKEPIDEPEPFDLEPDAIEADTPAPAAVTLAQAFFRSAVETARRSVQAATIADVGPTLDDLIALRADVDALIAKVTR